jgi:hypothetical protein
MEEEVLAYIWSYIDDVLGAEVERARRSGNVPVNWTRVLTTDAGWPCKERIPKELIVEQRFFPSVEGISRIREVGVLFPAKCCVCGDTATREFPLQPLSLVERARTALGPMRQMQVPHCDLHGGPFGSLLLHVDNPATNHMQVITIGLCRDFLDELAALHTDGDVYAPWVTFAPGLPGVGWTQGTNAEWWHDAWSPFWRGLSGNERLAYLRRWKASPDWREFLLNDGCWK